MDMIRSFVRPTATWGLLLAQIGLAFMWASGFGKEGMAEAAFAGLSPFTMMAQTYWFKEQTDRRADG